MTKIEWFRKWVYNASDETICILMFLYGKYMDGGKGPSPEFLQELIDYGKSNVDEEAEKSLKKK
jgi:hypothetical protein